MHAPQRDLTTNAEHVPNLVNVYTSL